MDADQVLRAAGRRSPGLVTLALLLCPAVRVEPELMRAVRLELIPKLPAGTEGDLWFSPLVSARGLDGIVLDAAVANLLRDRIRAILRPAAGAPAMDDGPAPGDIRRAWRLIEQAHVTSPPVLRLEETVNWLAVSEAEPAAGIEAELRRAVEALRRGRTGIARWAARALPRMPAAARSTTAAWLLAQGAGRRLASYEGGTSAPDIGRIDDLAALLPPRYDVPLGVNRVGDRLDLGDVGRQGASIRVLDTDPRVLTLSTVGGQGEQILQVPRDGLVSFGVGQGAVLLRTPRGEIYRVGSAVDDDSPVRPDALLSELRDSCVTVQQGRENTIGIAVAQDLILTVHSPQLSDPSQSSHGDEVVMVRGSSSAGVTGQWYIAHDELVLLRVAYLPEGVQPATLPPPRPSPPVPGTSWSGLTFGVSDAWSVINGVIADRVPVTGELTAMTDPSADRPAPGCPVVVNGRLVGMITYELTEGGFSVAVTALVDLLSTVPEPARLDALTSAAQAIALEFHLRFGGFSRAGGAELDTGALMAAAGLFAGQLDYLRGAAEFIIVSGTEVRTRPRWLTASGPRQFSAAVVAALDAASGALRSSGRPSLNPPLSAGRLSLTASDQEVLAQLGITLGSSASGGVTVALDTGLFGDSGWRRLRAVLVGELPGFDSWDPWSAAPAVGADRPQLLLGVVSGLCSREPSVPEPARTVLMAASGHLFPGWWGVRDELARRGTPDVSVGQGFPDFLEAYLGWCLTVLDQVRASAGGYRYEMGFAIPRGEAADLPTGRFGLEMSPVPSARRFGPETGPDQPDPGQPDAGVRLAGRFSSLVSFSAWVFLELADQVRLAAAQPPPYLIPPPPATA